jgi:hypothetical protein
MIDHTDIRPEDGIKKLRVSCETLRAILSEAYLRENRDLDEGRRLHAGIAHWVKVPVCECHACESLLADCRRAGRKRRPESQATPVISCLTAVRLHDKADAAADEGEEDRLLDLLEQSLVVHQCGNPGTCRVKSQHPGMPYEAAIEAMLAYEEFKADSSCMEVRTKSGSRYRLGHHDGERWVVREPSDGTEIVRERLEGLYRMGDRLLINDWITTPVVSSRTWPDPDKEREQALIAQAKAHKAEQEPPWELVLDDIEESLDRIEEAMEEVA